MRAANYAPALLAVLALPGCALLDALTSDDRLAPMASDASVAALDDGGPLDATPMGDGGGPIPANRGFATPTVRTEAWSLDGFAWTLEGNADWSCLGDSENLPPLTAFTLTGNLTSEGIPLDGAVVTARRGPTTIDMDTTAGGGGFSLSLTAGDPFIDFLVAPPVGRPTLLPRVPIQVADPTIALLSTTQDEVDMAATLLGEDAAAGESAVMGGMLDCDNNVVSGVIVTVSSAMGSPTHAGDVQSGYFDDAVPPVFRTVAQQGLTAASGRFAMVNVEPSSMSFLQAWGFTPAQDPATDELTLLAELRLPVPADTTIQLGMRPLRAPP